MRALGVFPRTREVRVVDIPAPRPTRAHDVLVRVREVGICGTDREICRFEYGTPPPGREMLILGHEALGEVEEVGPAVRSVQRGDLVVMTVRRACDEASCVACRAGRPDFCVSGHFHERGIKEADGFMAELVVEDEHNLVKLPRQLAEVGVLIEPLTVASKAAVELEAILRRYPWEPLGLRALVLGAGPLGLLGAMMLVSRNMETWVYSLEPVNSEPASIAQSFGARYISARDTPLSSLRARIGPVDIVAEAVGSGSVAFSALETLAPNGVFIFTGVPGGKRKVEIDLDSIMRNIVLMNQVLVGTVNASRSAFEASVRQLEQFMGLFPDAVRSLITERVELERAPELLTRPGRVKQVVQMAP